MGNVIETAMYEWRIGRIGLLAVGFALAILAAAFCLGTQGSAQKAYAADAVGPASVQLGAQANTSTSSVVKRYKGHCYKVFYFNSGDAADWATAKKACEKKGGHLVTITSNGERAFLEGIKDSGDYLWLGGYCTTDHTWKWVTGEKWSYENWLGGSAPSNWSSTDNKLGTWSDKWTEYAPTYAMDGYICEWDYDLSLSDSKLVLSAGDKTYVTYSLESPSGTISAKATWKSSNKAVAKVSSKGMVVAKATGSCKITCKVKGITKTVKVVVKPKKVTGLKAISKSSTFVQLQWTKQAGVSKYQVYYYDPDIMEYTLAKTVKGSLNTARVTGLSKSTTYKFKVRGIVKAWSKSYKGSYSKVYKAKTTR